MAKTPTSMNIYNWQRNFPNKIAAEKYLPQLFRQIQRIKGIILIMPKIFIQPDGKFAIYAQFETAQKLRAIDERDKNNATT